MTRPNFVFIMTDQHRADFLGCTGHPVLRTPHIDAIARRGTIMNRFHASNPVCMPNRSVFMSGLMSSVNGVRQNGVPLPRFVTTFPEVLSAAGYDTALFGKSHLQNFTSLKAPVGDNPAGTGRLANAIDVGDPAWYQWEDEDNWADNGPLDVELPFYGFQTADIVTLHGDNNRGFYSTWLAEQVEDPESLRGPQNQLPHDFACPQAVRTAVPEDLYSTSYIKRRAIDYLNDASRADAPFFTFVSFPDPHHPFTPPGHYWDMYSPDEMPDLDLDAHQNPPPHLQWVREQPFAAGDRFETAAVRFAPEHIKQAQALTCGMISMIDDAVGEIMATLEANGQADNTIVAFTSDHGDYLGDHGLMFKGGLHFQSLIRVPMIWADPRVDQPATSDVVATTLDLAPTILAAAEAQSPSGLQGIDLSPVLAGDSSAIDRQEVLIEEQTYFCDILGFEGQVRIRTLVDERWRFSVYHGAEWGELYDLVNDPGECQNLWDDLEFSDVRNELTWRLMQSQLAYTSQSPWPSREA